jgi:hypothetical protein
MEALLDKRSILRVFDTFVNPLTNTPTISIIICYEMLQPLLVIYYMNVIDKQSLLQIADKGNSPRGMFY